MTVQFQPTLDALLNHIASNIHLDPDRDAASALYRLGYSWYHCERRIVPRTKKVAGYVFYMTTSCGTTIPHAPMQCGFHQKNFSLKPKNSRNGTHNHD